jgi:hypothetical protein
MLDDFLSEKVILSNVVLLHFDNSWCAMNKLLTNRTENDIKNKWNSMKRKADRKREKAKKEAYILMSPNRKDAAIGLAALAEAQKSADTKKSAARADKVKVKQEDLDDCTFVPRDWGNAVEI